MINFETKYTSSTSHNHLTMQATEVFNNQTLIHLFSFLTERKWKAPKKKKKESTYVVNCCNVKCRVDSFDSALDEMTVTRGSGSYCAIDASSGEIKDSI